MLLLKHKPSNNLNAYMILQFTSTTVFTENLKTLQIKNNIKN